MAEIRVTQEYAEVLMQPVVNTRVTQEYAEVIVQPVVNTRVTQLYIEVLVDPNGITPSFSGLLLRGCG